MKLSAKKMREGCFNEKVYRWGTKFWRRIVCFALCVILFGANAVGTLAAEVPITETESQSAAGMEDVPPAEAVSYTHLRAHETGRNLVCRLLLEKKKTNNQKKKQKANSTIK